MARRLGLLFLVFMLLGPARADAAAAPARRGVPSAQDAGLRGRISVPGARNAPAPPTQAAQSAPAQTPSRVVADPGAGLGASLGTGLGTGLGAGLGGRLGRSLRAETDAGLGEGLGAFQPAGGNVVAPASARRGPMCRTTCAERRFTCLATDDSSCNAQWSQCVFNCTANDE